MYLYVKAFHLIAVVTLIGGILLLGFALTLADAAHENDRIERFVNGVLWWDGWITVPALAIVWMAGFTMAFGGGWGAAPWLLVKLVPVVFLTVLHGLEGAALKRAMSGGRIPAMLRQAPLMTLAAFSIIATLAVAKPF